MPKPARSSAARVSRIGDDERSACTDLLAESYTSGRLRRDEFEERMALALAAGTDVELARLTADLGPGGPGQELERHADRTPVISLDGRDLAKAGVFIAVAGFVSYLISTAYPNYDGQTLAWLVLWTLLNVSGAVGALLARRKS